MSADFTAIPSGMAIVVYAGERFNKIGTVLKSDFIKNSSTEII